MSAQNSNRQDHQRDISVTTVTRTSKQNYRSCIFAMLVFASGIALAQRTSELSADLPDARTMAIQQKVDKLYEAGVFERAFFIYRNELVPIGDKYAQYMVGFMHQFGLGIEQDEVAALAWYSLAAERGSPEFVEVHDRLRRNMSQPEVERAQAQYFELRQKYCDLAVLLASITRDYVALNEGTGYRVRSDSSTVVVMDPRFGADLGESYYGEIREQLESRLLLLREIGDFQDMNIDPDRISLRDLQRRVEQRIAAEAN